MQMTAAGAALVFPFEYTTADGSLGGRSTRVALHYQRMQFKAGQPVQGTREKSVDIMNLSSNNSYLRQVNARVSKADSKVDHLEGSVKKDIKSLENLAKAEEDTGALQEFAFKQSKGKSSKIKQIDAGKKGQSFASAVVATIKSLAANVEALDDELDERAKATAVIQGQLEKPFPLVASLRTASTGIVCNDKCSFTLVITNISDTVVDLEAMKDTKGVKVGEDVKVAFTVPLGAHRSDTLAASHSALGEIKSVTVGQVTVSPSKQNAELKLATDGTSVITLNLLNLIQFKALKQFLPRETIELTIDGCRPNNVPGKAVVQVKYSGLSGYPDASSNQAVFINKEAGIHSPLGSIIMWCGTTLPVGWVLCDGNNDRPDLSNRFIVGHGKKYKIGDTGGQNEVVLTTAQMPRHSHSMGTSGNHSHSAFVWTWKHYRSFAGGWGVDKKLKSTWAYSGDSRFCLSGNTNSAGNHTHSIWESGSSHAHENRPPYYALAFIMRKS